MISIKTIMTTNVISVKKSLPVSDALRLLMKHEISGIPVVDDKMCVIGILSEKDVLKILVDEKYDEKKTVEDYMSHGVICFTDKDDAVEICKFFINNHIRRVPIVKDGHLVGIVSRRDIVSLIIEAHSKMSDMRYT
jgi:CBS domain-containing protein